MKYHVEVECKTTGDKLAWDFDHDGGIFSAFAKVDLVVEESGWKPGESKRISIAVSSEEVTRHGSKS